MGIRAIKFSSRTYVLNILSLQLYLSNVRNSCVRMVHLGMTIRRSVIGNECYLKANKERESIVKTIEGTNYYKIIWISDTETISHALSCIHQEKKKMHEVANFVPTVSPAKSHSLPFFRHMPSKWSIGLDMIFRDHHIPILSEIVVIYSSDE